MSAIEQEQEPGPGHGRDVSGASVEQYARARIVTDSPDAGRAVPVILRYEDRSAQGAQDGRSGPDGEGGLVRVTLPDRGEWVFPRELLERGLRGPVTGGDIRIWPCGRVQAVIEFHRHTNGATVVQFDVKALIRFLRRTYTAVAPVTPQGVTR
ncbi:SsgA family sporulation/cell division regulator [Streptomyces sp. Q6]|uniref:SsgA family sporulation/cell division regulator n=1 Tax=Streptomyces citrinus TaxID=3118173 RepID=A0ACD5AG86_9ACTN